MSTKPINLLPHESSALAAGKLGALIRVFDNPPPEDMSPTSFRGPKMYHPTVEDDEGMEGPGEAVFGIYDDFGEWGCASPFGPPGTVLECREEWAQDWEHNRHFYKADADEDGLVPYLVGNEGGSGGGVGHAYIHEWQPADSMPSWAVRFRPVVGEVRCVQPPYITEDEWRLWCPPDTKVGPWPISSEYHPIEAGWNALIAQHPELTAESWLWLATINREGEV